MSIPCAACGDVLNQLTPGLEMEKLMVLARKVPYKTSMSAVMKKGIVELGTMGTAAANVSMDKF